MEAVEARRSAGLETLVERVERMEERLSERGVVEACAFVLRDGRGRVWASLNCEEGAPRLALFDTHGKQSAALAIESDGRSTLSLCDGKGRTRVTVGALPDGSVAVVLADEAGRQAASLGVLAHVPAWLDLVSADEKDRVGLGTLRDGAPLLSLCDREGRALRLVP